MKRKIESVKKFFAGKKKRKVLVIVVILLFIIANLLKKVDVGQNAVVFNSINGKISDDVSPGWHFVFPFVQTMTIYPTNEQTYKIYRDNKNWNDGIDASITTPTNDNQKVSIDATFVFSLTKEKLAHIYQKFNGEDISNIEKNYLDDIFKNAVVSTVSQYSAYEVYSTKRVKIQNKILSVIKEEIAKKGFELKDVYIDNVRLSEETESIIKAQAIAEADIIEAQGKSDANKLISNSLSDKIMTYEALGKLSENLKLIVVPSGTGSEMDFSKILEQMLEQSENTEE